MEYKARSWELRLDGLSAAQLEQHYKLYNGYVDNTNKLNKQLLELQAKGEGSTPQSAEIRRRLGFEYNGMRLHELYFDNLGGTQAMDQKSPLAQKMTEQWGSYEKWHEDFKNVATQRGIGWAILYQDPQTGALQNFWVSDHENGHPAGFLPLLVLDIWEHAFTVDYKPTERAKYLEAFFKNVDWKVVANRYVSVRAAASV